MLPLSLAILGVYGVLYFALTFALGVPQSRAVFQRVFRQFRKS
jgi:hypothetical protein